MRRIAAWAAAVRAGLGWSGRNSNVLVPGHGSWVVLGAVLVFEIIGPLLTRRALLVTGEARTMPAPLEEAWFKAAAERGLKDPKKALADYRAEIARQEK